MNRPAELSVLSAQVSNWGRWGEEDELGTLNYVSAESIVAAARCVRVGKVFSLAVPIGATTPVRPGGNRGAPAHEMTATGDGSLPARTLPYGAVFTDDRLSMHLQSGTQWDALAHIYYDDLIYNGRPASSVSLDGAKKCGIEVPAARFVGRGVLVDVARAQGLDHLAVGQEIGPADLEQALKSQLTELRPGDFLLVRTGLMSTWRSTGKWDAYWSDQPGLALSVAEWLHARQIAAVASDNSAVEKLTSEKSIPLHMVCLRDMGMPFGEFWYLEQLGDDCASDGRYEFMLAAQALPIAGAVGSPVNPIAVK